MLLFLILLVIGGYFYIDNLKKAGLPDYNENVKIEGLIDKVTVYRDRYGIPHIYAKNEADLYKVTGYITAQDRMWQMDFLRRVTQGRLSEIFGADLLSTDVMLRKLRIPDNSKKLLPTLEKEIRTPLDYFAEGVNQYLKDNKDNLPLEFKVLGYQPEKWKPENSLNLVGFMAWSLELGYRMEAMLQVLKGKVSEEKINQLLPDFNLQKSYVYADYKSDVQIDTALVADLEKLSDIMPDIFTGSNNWVVSGKKSTTGKPIFSNDMHLGLNIPGIWSQIHQNIEGRLNVTGVILPGEPFVVAGHNEHISWGMTNVMLDGADFYLETINPENQAQYKFNGEWKNMEVRKEKIYIKGEDKPVEKVLYFTHRGPIFTSFDSLATQPVSMHWIGNEDSREIEALYKLGTAKNWNDFTNAIKGFQSVSQNIAYADTDGNIGIHMTGRLPVRTAPGYLFLPGDTDKYDWKGYVAFDSLPYEYNPERGFVSSANNKSIDNKYQYYISEWYDVPYRIKRIRQMLTAKEKLSVDDFKKMLFDHHAVQADEMKPVFIKYIERLKDLNSDEQKALRLLKEWNNTYEKNLAAPLVFDEMFIQLAKNLTRDEMGNEVFSEYQKSMLFSKYLLQYTIANDGSAWCDDVNTEKKETLGDMIQKSFKETIAKLMKKYGDFDKIKWGEIHRLELKHPLGKLKVLDIVFGLNRSVKAPGNSNTVNPFSYSQANPYQSDFGASEKHIFNTANYDESFSVIPTGVSGIPGSKHYCDQTEMYVAGKLHPDYISREKVEKHAVYKAVFSRK